MSNLYKEALIETQNLKKLAEEDAKKKILEEISPLIKKAITEQINEVTESFFVEDNAEDGMNPNGPAVDVADTTTDPTGMLNAQTGGLPNPDNEAPLSAKGEQNVMSATMPGQDGKITVDFEDLFTTGDPLGMNDPMPTEIEVPPVADPMTLEPDSIGPNDPNEVLTREGFIKTLSSASEKINEAFYLENLTLIGKEKLQQKLFNLLENLDVLKQNKTFNEKEARKSENKLDFLFLKLKEAKLTNSYIVENDRRDQENMKSLKEYAARLFEEDSTVSDSADKKLNHKSTASDEHAKKQSGVSPEVGGPADLKAATEKVNGKSTSEKQWAEGEPELKEEVDVDDAELKEAIESLTKVDSKEGWEKGEPEEVDPSHKNLKEDISDDLDLGDDGDVDPMASDMPGDDLAVPGDDVDAGVDPDIVLNIELPDEIEDALANIDIASMGDIKVDVDASALGSAGGADVDGLGADMDDDMELDFGDESADVDAPVAGPEEEDEISEGFPKMKEAFIKLLKNNKILEAKLKQAVAENKALKESVQKDRTALKEANLFLAKNVYFTKFLQRNDISKKNIKKIVEYLDRAESVNDAKGIYNKIKAKLAESANASNKLAGSPSKVTTPGSANKTLTESVSHSSQVDEDGFDTSRWAVIAGINKSK